MKKIRNNIFYLFLVFACCSVAYLSYYFFSDIRTQKANDALQQQAQTSASTTTSSQASSQVPESQSTSEPEPEVIPIDFAALQSENEHIYSYIEVPNTEIAFPILQHPSDNTYYLRRGVDKAYSVFGVIYTELWNKTDFSDYNTVIYGHDTLDGRMFGPLRNYYDSDYLANNRDIIIYTPTEKRTYKIFAAIVYDDRHIPYTYDSQSSDSMLSYVDTLKEFSTHNADSTFMEDVAITADSHLITLSTCYGNWTNERFLIVAAYEE